VNNLYFKSFISTKFNVEQKLEIINHHYSFLKNSFKKEEIKELFEIGIQCWSERIEKNSFFVKLHPATSDLREGCLRLNFRFNEVDIFNLAFTIVPGKLLTIDASSVICISRVQYENNQHINISRATKILGYITPLKIVLHVLEGIACAFGICSIVGISTNQHVKFIESKDDKLFDKNYGLLWQKMNASKMQNGNFYLPCPFPKRPLSFFKQKYRPIILNKRNSLMKISSKTCKKIEELIQPNTTLII
jgi:uncharacterized protein VirK/YbjX